MCFALWSWDLCGDCNEFLTFKSSTNENKGKKHLFKKQDLFLGFGLMVFCFSSSGHDHHVWYWLLSRLVWWSLSAHWGVWFQLGNCIKGWSWICALCWLWVLYMYSIHSIKKLLAKRQQGSTDINIYLYTLDEGTYFGSLLKSHWPWREDFKSGRPSGEKYCKEEEIMKLKV